MDENEKKGRTNHTNKTFMSNIEEYLDTAFRNSYDVIINYKSAKDFITSEDGYFIHHPAEPVTKEILEDMRVYFSENEEYEKCIKILKYISDEYN